jgi:hypothetical protein
MPIMANWGFLGTKSSFLKKIYRIYSPKIHKSTKEIQKYKFFKNILKTGFLHEIN